MEECFSNKGQILSARSALKEDHTPIGYGFVTFKDINSANAAIEEYNPDAKKDLIAIPYNPKDKKDMAQKSVNNIYVKSFPESWNEEKLK